MANLLRYNRQATLARSVPLAEAMNQFLRDSFTTPMLVAALSAPRRDGGLSGMNLYERDDSYILQIPLPGVKSDQLRISVRENVLTLQGRIEFPVPEGARPLLQEAGGEEFRERVVLPGDVDAEQAQADYQDGVLTLTLPKAPHARERKVPVRRGRSRRDTDGQGRRSDSGGPQEHPGWREEPGHTGVYPVSAMAGASPDAPIKGEMEWGQGERGAAGYEDHGESELITIPPDDSSAEQ